MERYYVYTLLSLLDKKFYTGFTANLKQRLQQHARGEVKSTKNRRPLKLIHQNPSQKYPRPRYESISARPRSDDESVPYRHIKEESTRVLRKLAISHKGCGNFLVPLCCGFVAVATATASSPRLADTRKFLATRDGSIFEMGSINIL